ncbi:hypothetical protein LWI29_005349 [Acer saccharum]|uniref:Uncharacterized protein n=1 Tax=Acer saccharum TaxID=4024 RepID=A0AA39VXA1_ACESA|nr:hypothetical protein LWI29_005349 [Acer saccharum]
MNYDVNKYNVDLSSISIVPGSTCRTFIRNGDDVQFMLGEDRVIPQVCVSLTERTAGYVVAVDHADTAEPQFGDVFGCQIEQYDAQYNEQNNYNYPNHEVDNEANNEQVDDLQNADEEPAQMQTHGRRVEGVSGTAPKLPGTSEVRYNVTASESVNATTWVFPGVDSYSFGTSRSSILAA